MPTRWRGNDCYNFSSMMVYAHGQHNVVLTGEDQTSILNGQGGTPYDGVLTHEAGECVPWHYHTQISDSFVCLEGPMVVETRAPRHVYRLLPGERVAVPPKTAHYVHGEADGACKFLIEQGVGVYDFVAVGG